ncbi:hypothetical protein C2I27_04150 [Priestia megaterium]|uniref:hypothetical protein n=1 Tax=Priestia megaterium TaxID=1404 RepID=UPI000D5064F1|nr:hypothetical protein [Priestia megaterium]PVC75085.1 hypothetical protein C2I27_04150 [Priestia megaterium]
MSKTLIPMMRNNSQDGYVVTSSQMFSSDFGAFDGTYSGTGSAGTFFRSSIAPKLPEYISIRFPRMFTVNGYKIHLGYYHTTYTNMRTWDFQGLVNNEWITLHEGVHTSEIRESLEFSFPDVQVNSVRILCKSRFGTNSWGLDELEVYGEIVPAKVGEAVIVPDPGWKRYDDSHGAIYYGKRTITSLTSTTGGSFSNDVDDVRFSFTGSKLRIIGILSVGRTGNMNITIDGVSYDFSEYSTNSITNALVFEKTDLSSGKHTVIIRSGNANAAAIDAIDIDENGRLLHINEVLNINDLTVGKCIRVNYSCNKGNTYGSFSGLGKENADFIPPKSTSTPNGDFYFIMVQDLYGKKTLVADRCIANNIAWDTLNAEGITSGSGTPFYLSAIPKLSSDAGSNGKSFSSGYVNTNYAWRAFDKDLYSSNNIKWQSPTVESFIGYQFNSPTLISFYSLMIQNDGTTGYLSEAPKEWVFEASNDNINWDILDKQIDITGWMSLSRKTFDLTTEKPYTFYRVNIKANNGESKTSIAELDMYEKVDTHTFKIRLLTGGVSPTDKDNEWDNWIVGSSLNGTIQPGDNSIWNWQGVYSSTSTSYLSTQTNKIGRGNGSVEYYVSYAPSNNSSSYGFRPVLEIETNFVLKNYSYIYENHEYKKYADIIEGDMLKDISFLEEGSLLKFPLNKYAKQVEVK